MFPNLGASGAIAGVLATLRGIPPEAVAEATSGNALRALPRLAGLVTPARPDNLAP